MNGMMSSMAKDSGEDYKNFHNICPQKAMSFLRGTGGRLEPVVFGEKCKSNLCINSNNKLHFKNIEANVPKVSVIVPVYNVGDYLKRSLECLSGQTLKDIEIICIDDGSSDNSLNILREYEKKDSRFKVISFDRNCGAAATRNKGLEIAKGEYLGFIDPDDAIDLNYYEELYKKASEQDFDVVKCKRKVINTDGTIKKSNLNDLVADKHRYFFAYEWTTGLYRKKLIDENNIKFHNLLVGEDTLFLNEVMMASKSFSMIDNVFYYYYKREGSLLDYSVNSLKKANDLIFSAKTQILNINKTEIFEENKSYYNKMLFKRMQTILDKFFMQNSNKIRYAYAKCIMDLFYMHKDPEYFAKHFKLRRLLKYIINKDVKGLFHKLKEFDNYSDMTGNNFWQNIFSIRNKKRGNRKYKIITILGLKIKLKKKSKLKSKLKSKQVYYYNKNHNFGDFLNLDLFKFFNYESVWTKKNRAEIVALGSLLQGFVMSEMSFKKKFKVLFSKPIIVYGTGFIRKESDTEYLSRKLDVRAVRGYYTLNRLKGMKHCKICKNIAIGDPGLLVSKIFDTTNAEKKYDLGIILHYIDKDSPFLKNIQVSNSVVLDINENPKELILKMAECKNIISSAMHGLIAADSLGIPNMRLVVSDKIIGGDYKFNDYYSAFGIKEHKRIDLNKQSFTDADLPSIKENYKIEKSQVEKIQQDLIKAFPYRKD